MPPTPPPVHVYSAYAAHMKAALEAAFPDRPVILWDAPGPFTDGLPEVSYLLALKPPSGQWGRARRLRLLQAPGAGVDHLYPLDGLRPEAVFANSAGISVEPMSDFALALVLMMIKRLPWAATAQRDRLWRPFLPGDARQTTLGILGLGRIGEALARKAAALGMRVIGTRSTPRPVAHVEAVHGAGDTARVAAEADVLVCLLPLTEATRGLIGSDILGAMKKTASFINLGRGGVVDEAALAAALVERRLACAALDVAEREPLPPDSPLWETPNLVLTPHVAGGFPGHLDASVAVFAENVRRLEAGQTVRTAVDRMRGY
ncbi:MAG: D-2-hydroxyacid dehydrogenase [Alphaproteobacteria bacterium]|nr:D-2-hydroxyacid dehydrogenase [Alphaproteobacteria bacterium]